MAIWKLLRTMIWGPAVLVMVMVVVVVCAGVHEREPTDIKGHLTQ